MFLHVSECLCACGSKATHDISLIRAMNMTGIHDSVEAHRCVNIHEEIFQ